MENLEIEVVDTNNIVYYSKKAPSQREFKTKVQIYECKFEKTSYGSVIITRLGKIIELYPSIIGTIYFKNP